MPNDFISKKAVFQYLPSTYVVYDKFSVPIWIFQCGNQSNMSGPTS